VTPRLKKKEKETEEDTHGENKVGESRTNETSLPDIIERILIICTLMSWAMALA
jgi:hypothetical protein